MHRRITRLLIAASCAVVTVGAGAATAQAAPSQGRGPVVVVSGLNNPRQLSLVHGNVLLIAEAGKGGTLAHIGSPENGTEGLGYTGSISAVLAPAFAHNQHPYRIVTGLLSAAADTPSENGPVGSGATGPDGVSARSLSRISVIETTFGRGPDAPPVANPFDGRLLLTSPFGRIHVLADITGYEQKHDPDGMGVDSDPYAVLDYRDGWLVADAAGNDILKVDRWGHISVFHVFPNVTTGACASQSDPTPQFPGCNWVPTSLATDHWGNVYVGGLSSLTPGEAQVVKLDRHGHLLKTWTGFTAVTGVAVSDNGALYVSQLMATEANPANPAIQGVLTKIRGSQRTNVDVPFPAGIALDGRGNVFVSAYSLLPDTGAGIPGITFDTSGQVWRLRF
jgi:hypothetical protein